MQADEKLSSYLAGTMSEGERLAFEMSMLDDPGIDRSRTREYLQLIAGENARLSRLIEHFLTFSRVDRNGQRLVFRDVQPTALIAQTLAATPGRERFPGLTVAVAPDLPPLYGDDDALVTVLLNLLENAFKYSGEHKQVSLRVRTERGHVLFAVEDNGIGISRRDRKRIFRPFYQVDQRHCSGRRRHRAGAGARKEAAADPAGHHAPARERLRDLPCRP